MTRDSKWRAPCLRPDDQERHRVPLGRMVTRLVTMLADRCRVAVRRTAWTLFGHRCDECARLRGENEFLRSLLLIAVDELERGMDALTPPRHAPSPAYWQDAQIQKLWQDIQAANRFDVIDGGAA